MAVKLPKLYAITDRRLSGLPHPEQVDLLCAGGAKLVQMRDKELSSLEFHRQAQAALEIVKRYDARLIVNDRVDIALAIGADGVHLGQNDLPVEVARDLMGSAAIVGVSTHNLEQAQRALTQPVDYIAFGPIFRTQTKENPDPEVGLEGLRLVRQLTDLSLVAIGGIKLQTVAEVIAAGADSVALIGDLVADSEQIQQRTKVLLAALSNRTAETAN